MLDRFDIFDAHLHIIDDRFPLTPNRGYLPDAFTADDYLRQTDDLCVCGGAVVSGSFQAFDQTYLIDALQRLGPSFVGVSQIPATAADEQIIQLHEAGVRALRFNLRRGASEQIKPLAVMAHRVHALCGWHVELYIDSSELSGLYALLAELPAASIDHLGLSRSGLHTLQRLVERGVRVKASGFGRVDFAVTPAIRDLYAANPKALMFGTDLPATRSPRRFHVDDIRLIIDALGNQAAQEVLSHNAIEFYNLHKAADGRLRRTT